MAPRKRPTAAQRKAADKRAAEEAASPNMLMEQEEAALAAVTAQLAQMDTQLRAMEEARAELEAERLQRLGRVGMLTDLNRAMEASMAEQSQALSVVEDPQREPEGDGGAPDAG